MTEIELKPCPFCGGKADFNNDGERWQQVICGSCGCRGCEYPDDKAKAASFWNRRPTPEAGLLERVAVYCDQQAAIERSEGESMCDPANFSSMRAYEEVAKFARGLLSASGTDDGRKSLETIVRAVEINDGDTLSRIATDSKVIWTASGSWGGKQDVTLGDLRAVAKWYRESNPLPVYNIPQID